MEEVDSNGKYYCSKCDFKCKYPAHWNQHLISNKHNNVKRKARSDKILEPKCKLCDYQTNKTTNMKLHYLNHHSTKEERKKSLSFTVMNAIMVHLFNLYSRYI